MIDESQLKAMLIAQNIIFKEFSHEPLFTVAQSQVLRGELGEGFHCKNMFLRDKAKQYYLLTIQEDAQVDLKKLAKIIGAKGNLSFASPEDLWQYCAVIPGSVTPLAVVNDTNKCVKLLLDSELIQAKICFVHPLRNDKTFGIAGNDIAKFLAQTHQFLTIEREDIMKNPKNDED